MSRNHKRGAFFSVVPMVEQLMSRIVPAWTVNYDAGTQVLTLTDNAGDNQILVDDNSVNSKIRISLDKGTTWTDTPATVSTTKTIHIYSLGSGDYIDLSPLSTFGINAAANDNWVTVLAGTGNDTVVGSTQDDYFYCATLS